MTKKSTAKAPKSIAAKPTLTAPVVVPVESDKLGKMQLIEQVAQRASLTKKDAALAVDTALAAIVDALKKGQAVGLPGLGTLDVRATAARAGVRPGTAEKIQIPAGKKVGFKVAADLKKAL